MASSSELSKAKFVKLESLDTESSSVNLVVRVLTKEVVVDREEDLRYLKLAECLVGDESGRILFTARNDQCDQMVLGNTVELRNARIKLHNGYMRLIVDKWGLIETEHDRGNIEEDDIPDTNFSDIHHEE